jgi:hypothetical protein
VARLLSWPAITNINRQEITMPITVGTSHFVSRAAAVAYYRDYGYDDTGAAVDRKLAEGEIHIGPPTLKPGQTLGTTDGGRRYTVTDAA